MAKGKKNEWAFKRFFSPVKWNYWFLIKPFLSGCFYSFFTILTVEIFKKATTLIKNYDAEWVKKLIITYIIIVCVYIVFNYIVRNVSIWIQYKWTQLIQKKLFPEFFKLDNTTVEKLWTWKLQFIMNDWINLRWWLFKKLCEKVPDLIITTIYVLYQIYLTGWIKFILIFAVIFCIIFILIKSFQKRRLPEMVSKRWIMAEHWRQFVKMIMSKMEILQNNKEQFEIEKDNEILQTAFKSHIKINNWARWIYRVWTIFSFILNIFILYYWYLVITNNGDLSLFVWLLASATLFQKVIDNSAQLYKEFTNEFAGVQKLWDTFAEIPKMKNTFKDTPFKYKSGDIEIKDITFGYTEDRNVFEHFSLNIKWWTKTAFVWESGSWKTTLMKLIAWYLLLEEWEIYVDKQEIHHVDLYSYFSHIWFLTQDPSVFDWTIYDNLVYALKEQPTDAKLKKVIKAAKCEFIYDFTEWLQTEIWERWVRLSWWQKQRLAIAKIMLKNPDIILLDEPTSALDSFNEEEISQALSNLFKWKTVIIIAHRLQTVKSADRILLFEEWKVVEYWTHQSLIRKNWKYKKMLDLQSGF